MKKLIIMIILSLLLIGCSPKPLDIVTKVADMSAYNIESERFLEISFKDSNTVLTKGTGVVYYGFDTCPWCLALIPILDEVATSNSRNIYYVDTRPDGIDIRTDDNKDYMAVVELVKAYLLDDENGNPRLYVPQLFFVKDGKIISAHADTLPDHDARERALTEAEKQELSDLLDQMFKAIAK